jgi:DNA-binding CsgD family transcriptional regulator
MARSSIHAAMTSPADRTAIVMGTASTTRLGFASECNRHEMPIEARDVLVTDVPLLSKREIDCLRCTAMGARDYEIANALAISRSTVRFHLRNACRKLTSSNRCAAIYSAAKLDII